MNRYLCWSPVREDDEHHAKMFEATSPQQHAAEKYAEDFHYRRDGWEHREWPIVVWVRSTADASLAEIEVDREAVPAFTARRRNS